MLFGDDGRDTLTGSSGTDTLAGGSGGDTHFGGDASDNVYGGEGDDRIDAGFGKDSLIGDSGDDYLDGGAGVDSAFGRSGDDTFVVDNTSDRVGDESGLGTDLVLAQIDFTLPIASNAAEIENLRLLAGFGNLDGAGNSLDNHIQGNSASNRLAGNQGDDRLEGGAGNDRLFGGQGGDHIEGGSGADTLAMGSDDTAFGGSGADWFRFTGLVGSAEIGDFDGVSLNAGNSQDKFVFATGLEMGAFSYIGGAVFSSSGSSQARFAGGNTIEVDADGDGSADRVFQVIGLNAEGQLTATDFLWQ